MRKPDRIEIVRRGRERGLSLPDLERIGISKPERYLPYIQSTEEAS